MNFRHCLGWLLQMGWAEPAAVGLRNKPGGMAMIKRIHTDFGGEQLNGRVVRTVRVFEGSSWLIDAPQAFVCTAPCMARDGWRLHSFETGDSILIGKVPDANLDPLPGIEIPNEEIEQLYAPGPEIRTRERA